MPDDTQERPKVHARLVLGRRGDPRQHGGGSLRLIDLRTLHPYFLKTGLTVGKSQAA